MDGLKTCSRCNEAKPLSSFNKRAKSADGVAFTCGECRAKYHQSSRAIQLANMARWRAEFPERNRALAKHFLAYKRGYLECDCCSQKDLVAFLETMPQGMHADHIVSATQGGKHCVYNLQFLSPEEHRAKTGAEHKARKVAK